MSTCLRVFTTPQTGSFSGTFASGETTRSAFLSAERIDLDAAAGKRHFNGRSSKPFWHNAELRPLTSRYPQHHRVSSGWWRGRQAPFTHGGSSPSDPSFLRPPVKYNSVSKSQDLGSVNFLARLREIGSQVGSPTLFFKMHILGDATLRITKNSSNRYTDKSLLAFSIPSGSRSR